MSHLVRSQEEEKARSQIQIPTTGTALHILRTTSYNSMAACRMKPIPCLLLHPVIPTVVSRIT